MRPQSRNHLVVAVGLAALGSAAGPAFGGTEDWITYVEATNTRLVAEASVGVSDIEEKDYVLGDVDQDGDTDVVVLRKKPFSTPGGRRNVLFMNESGVLTDRTATLAPDLLDNTDDRDGRLIDVDGDGWIDLITAGTFGEQSRVVMNLGEDGNGEWLGFDYVAGDQRLPNFTFPKFCAVAAGDLTGDGKPDLFFTDYDNTLEDRLLINDGNGFFTDQTATRMTAAMSSSTFGNDAEIADLNGDGFKDIIKNNSTGASPPSGFSPRISVLYNDGTGNFTFMDNIYTLAPYMNDIADFTGDGKLDLFVVDDGQDRFMINTGNNAQGRAQFTIGTVTTSPVTSFFGGNARFADLDNDGILDVIVADVDTDEPGCGRRLALLRGLGTQPNVSFGDPLVGSGRVWLKNGVFDAAPFYINDDNVLDLLIGTCSGTHVFLGQLPALFRDGFESGNTSAWKVGTVP